jgi:hypothetical protein
MVTDHLSTRERGREIFDVVEKVLDLCVGCGQWLEKGDIKSLSFSFALLEPLHCCMA